MCRKIYSSRGSRSSLAVNSCGAHASKIVGFMGRSYTSHVARLILEYQQYVGDEKNHMHRSLQDIRAAARKGYAGGE